MRGKRWIVGLLFLVWALAAGGGSRELEDRSFPTALAAENKDLGAAEAERQEMSSRYIDYGHVKAVVLSERAARDGESLRGILTWLESEPVFARSLLVFTGDGSALEQVKEDEKSGLILEDLIKNQPQRRMLSVSLKDVLNYFHNGEPSIRLPKVTSIDGELQVSGSTELKQTVVPAVHMAYPRMPE